jgi:hypothetical protein
MLSEIACVNNVEEAKRVFDVYKLTYEIISCDENKGTL